MPKNVQIFNLEQMQEEELEFIQRKYFKESRIFKRTMTVIATLAMVIPGVLGIIVNVFKEEVIEGAFPETEPEPFTLLTYFIIVFFILLLLFIGGFMGYTHSLKKLKKDLKEKMKIIEKTEIIKKQFIPNNQSCYFYLNSANKLSIEVSKTDFESFKVGDEINLEYSRYAKIYFGYF